jgi:ElaB/YqjD/DUF883 family membrane-anchored ribosome-binding protein
MQPVRHSGSTQQRQPGSQASGSEGITGVMTDTAKGLAATATDYAGQTKEKVSEWASAAAQGAGKATEQVQEWASTAADKTGEAFKSGGEELTRFIRRNPWPVLLVGFGVGLLIGRTMRS